MVGNFYSQLLFNGFFNLLNPCITKFKDLPVIDIYKMVMLFKSVGFFELGTVVSELMFCYEIAIKQKFDSIVKCGPAYPVFIILHSDIQCLDIKMAFCRVYFFEYGKTLRSFTMTLPFQVFSKNFFYGFKCIFI